MTIFGGFKKSICQSVIRNPNREDQVQLVKSGVREEITLVDKHYTCTSVK
jgi:hypothetical protein